VAQPLDPACSGHIVEIEFLGRTYMVGREVSQLYTQREDSGTALQ
jgi:hypothetical protein